MQHTLARHWLYALSQNEVAKLIRWQRRVDVRVWSRRGFKKPWQRVAAIVAMYAPVCVTVLWLITQPTPANRPRLSGVLNIGLAFAVGELLFILMNPACYTGVALRKLDRLRTKAASDITMNRRPERLPALQPLGTIPFDSRSGYVDPVLSFARSGAIGTLLAMSVFALSINTPVFASTFPVFFIFAMLSGPTLIKAVTHSRIRRSREHATCPDCRYPLSMDQTGAALSSPCPECGLRYPLFDMVQYLRTPPPVPPPALPLRE